MVFQNAIHPWLLKDSIEIFSYLACVEWQFQVVKVFVCNNQQQENWNSSWRVEKKKPICFGFKMHSEVGGTSEFKFKFLKFYVWNFSSSTSINTD